MNDEIPALRPRVYLAGPSVFRLDAKSFGEYLRGLCRQAGLKGCYPLDNDIEGKTGLDLANAIFQGNVDLIDTTVAVVAEISPFRGPNMDPGTAWEIGYAYAKKLPIFLWTTDNRTILERTKTARSITSSGQRHYDEQGLVVEDFELIENLMIAAPVVQVYQSAQDAISACASLLIDNKH